MGAKLLHILAPSYFPAGLPLQYRHRSGVSPPSSGWIGVVPPRRGTRISTYWGTRGMRGTKAYSASGNCGAAARPHPPPGIHRIHLPSADQPSRRPPCFALARFFVNDVAKRLSDNKYGLGAPSARRENQSSHVATRFKSLGLLGCLSCVRYRTSTWHLS